MFSKLEFMIAGRYLGSKRKEGFISVTALFSFFGIMIPITSAVEHLHSLNLETVTSGLNEWKKWHISEKF